MRHPTNLNYFDYMTECAKAYLRRLYKEEKTVCRMAYAAGINRTHLYKMIRAFGLKEEFNIKRIEGNDQWKDLKSKTPSPANNLKNRSYLARCSLNH